MVKPITFHICRLCWARIQTAYSMNEPQICSYILTLSHLRMHENCTWEMRTKNILVFENLSPIMWYYRRLARASFSVFIFWHTRKRIRAGRSIAALVDGRDNVERGRVNDEQQQQILVVEKTALKKKWSRPGRQVAKAGIITAARTNKMPSAAQAQTVQPRPLPMSSQHGRNLISYSTHFDLTSAYCGHQ